MGTVTEKSEKTNRHHGINFYTEVTPRFFPISTYQVASIKQGSCIYENKILGNGRLPLFEAILSFNHGDQK